MRRVMPRRKYNNNACLSASTLDWRCCCQCSWLIDEQSRDTEIIRCAAPGNHANPTGSAAAVSGSRPPPPRRSLILHREKQWPFSGTVITNHSHAHRQISCQPREWQTSDYSAMTTVHLKTTKNTTNNCYKNVLYYSSLFPINGREKIAKMLLGDKEIFKW